jgi:hypothetical protein
MASLMSLSENRKQEEGEETTEFGLPRNIIESGYVREQGTEVKFEGEGGVAGEDGVPEVFGGVREVHKSYLL